MANTAPIERALGYVRISTRHRAGVGIADQKAGLGDHYRRFGVDLVEIYRDRGRAGTADHRPGLQALLDHAARIDAGITEIGVHGFSRLFRDRDLFDHFRWTLEQAGVRIAAIADEEVSGNRINMPRGTS